MANTWRVLMILLIINLFVSVVQSAQTGNTNTFTDKLTQYSNTAQDRADNLQAEEERCADTNNNCPFWERPFAIITDFTLTNIVDPILMVGSFFWLFFLKSSFTGIPSGTIAIEIILVGILNLTITIIRIWGYYELFQVLRNKKTSS
jgi:hypothetical protein